MEVNPREIARQAELTLKQTDVLINQLKAQKIHPEVYEELEKTKQEMKRVVQRLKKLN